MGEAGEHVIYSRCSSFLAKVLNNSVCSYTESRNNVFQSYMCAMSAKCQFLDVVQMKKSIFTILHCIRNDER